MCVKKKRRRKHRRHVPSPSRVFKCSKQYIQLSLSKVFSLKTIFRAYICIEVAWHGMVWHRLLNVLGRTYVHTRAQLKNPGNMFHCYFMHLSCCKKLLCMVSFVFFLTLFADPFCILSFWSILNLELSTSHMTQVSRNSIFKPFRAWVFVIVGRLLNECSTIIILHIFSSHISTRSSSNICNPFSHFSSQRV